MNKFQQVSRLSHQGGTRARGALYSEVSCLEVVRGWDWGFLYREVQCIMGNGHMRPPCGQNDSLTDRHY